MRALSILSRFERRSIFLMLTFQHRTPVSAGVRPTPTSLTMGTELADLRMGLDLIGANHFKESPACIF